MKNKITEFYKKRFNEFGHHEASLGWTKGKQFIRFYALTKNFQLAHTSILDVGCGFGDFINFSKKFSLNYSAYCGVDLVEEFIEIGQKQFGNDPRNSFIAGDFFEHNSQHDFVIGSGVFGQKTAQSDDENYVFVERLIKKALDCANQGIAFDFISDKVDYRTSDNDFHASPSRILDIAYKYSKNVMLDNSIMPFEFTLIIYKNQNFSKEKTVFDSFLNSNVDFVTDTSKKC
jgi:SAM-dependent methyltransferase